jgi:tetratricopeptide (TPR) repeat protein
MSKKKKAVRHRQIVAKPGQKKIIAHKKAEMDLRWMLPCILLATFLVYVPCFKGAFVWDDSKYIQNNPVITSIDFNMLFSKYVMGNYHPLTMLGYAIQYQFFGLSTTGYHVVNLLLHLFNVALVFYAILYLTNNNKVALVTSLFFGIHPLHVESVAWISELKDLLYTFFFLAAYVLYVKYVKQQTKRVYYFSILLFLCSLLSKGMAVSFPVVLLLTDYFMGRKFTRQTILEKIPFFVLAIIFGIIAIYAQKSSEAIQDIAKFSFFQRIIFACYGFVTYIIKLISPFHLSAFYPYPINSGESLRGYYYFYPLLFLLIVGLLIYSLRYSKKIFFGIGFFAITVFLVLQLLPVGDAIMADRYSYLSSFGIFYLAGEGFIWLWNRNQKTPAVALTALFVIFFSLKTYSRCRVWENGLNLWSDVIDKYPNVAVAYNNRGGTLINEKRYEEAITDFSKAIELRPDYYDAYNNRGILFMDIQKNGEALRDFNKAIELEPTHAEVYSNRGLLLMQFNKNKEALADFDKAIQLQPNYSQAYYNRGLLATNEGRKEQAFNDYAMALKFNPAYAEAYINRGVLFHQENKLEEALTEYTKAIKLNPANPQVYYNIGLIMMNQKKYAEGITNFSKAIELQNNYPSAYYNRGLTEVYLQNKDAACKDFQVAQKLGFPSATDALKMYCQ